MDISFFAIMLFFVVALACMAFQFKEPFLLGMSGVISLLLGSFTIKDGITKTYVVANSTNAIEVVKEVTGGGEMYGLILILLGTVFLLSVVVRRGE